MPDRDGARPRRPDRGEARDRRRGRRRAAPQPARRTASTRATRCGSDGARRQRCCSAPRRTARAGPVLRSHSKCRPEPRKEATKMADRPDELNILVPNEQVAAVHRMVTRRQALYAGGAAAMAAYAAGCGGSTGGGGESGGSGGGGGNERGLGREAPDAGRRQGRGRRPAAGELGRLLRSGELQGLREGVRPHRQGLRLRLERRDPRQAAGGRLEVRRDLADRLRGEDDGGPRPDHAAHARADPEPVEPLAGVHEDRLRPRATSTRCRRTTASRASTG